MKHVAIGVEYDGQAFHGFQKQVGLPTVQGELEKALSQIADHPVKLVTAGRTDTGVHATGQVINFSSSAVRKLDAWINGTNSLTSSAITVHWARSVDKNFSARFSALDRRYLYVWHRSEQVSAISGNYVSHTRELLNEKEMHEAVQQLVGEHNFTSFRAAGCQSKTAHREVYRARVARYGESVVLDITANAFLQHMVRNIAGSLHKVGSGLKPAEWIKELLELENRTLAAATASPRGLYLVHVRYPEKYKIPGPHIPIVLQNQDI